MSTTLQTNELTLRTSIIQKINLIFNDEEYTFIMQLFRESNTVEGTVIRFYFEERDSLNKWKRIEPSFNQM